MIKPARHVPPRWWSAPVASAAPNDYAAQAASTASAPDGPRALDNRLDVFRLLVQAGPDGMPAGAVAEALSIAPNTLTFHFDRLRMAGLITVRRDWRSMIYAAQFDTMNGLLAFLTENCCGGAASRP
ncbi:helix-turn-helix domain-containing protein [Bradyrhizobium sp. NAS80.1]|uniref:ArsR/SmtB family transcription factor n=1 Tax=Bradyrhizobium sp. NAS80.1 TaxID=1680159 RepID=UPI0024C05017|nr:helix-turn-helix domain-containing protein [Bradyrhizobium sp. NAS80.1]